MKNNIELKTGDILNTHTPFVWYKIMRYLPIFIRFFEKLKWGQYAWASHTAIVVIEDGAPFVYEADPSVKRTAFADWCQDLDISITRLPDNFNEKTDAEIQKMCQDSLGEKYNFAGLLIWQPIYILTDKWFGQKFNGRVYCSQFVAQIFSRFFGQFNDSYEISPAKILEDTINYEIYRGKAKDLL